MGSRLENQFELPVLAQTARINEPRVLQATTTAKGFCGEKFHHKSKFFRHKATFVATFLIATSRHKYSPHKYSSDDFSFPTNGHTH
jgi:hypothetical protein